MMAGAELANVLNSKSMATVTFESRFRKPESTDMSFDLVPRSNDISVLTGRWVYKIKKKPDESILYKAH